MKCKIADLTVEIPTSGGLASRTWEYLTHNETAVDFEISEDNYRSLCWPNLSEEDMIYMESGFSFYGNLLRFNGLMLHSSAVALDGKGYLFSGPCGMGKSTHTRLWQSVFGDEAKVFNDDKPALRRLDGKWFAYGTPWCGKDHININMKVPLAGICFLKQSDENKIRRLTPQEATPLVISQTMRKFKQVEYLNLMLSTWTNSFERSRSSNWKTDRNPKRRY